MATSNRHRVMAIAHRAYTEWASDPEVLPTEKPTLWRHALNQAWQMERFRARLADGAVAFQYIKADGSIRKALGTLNLMLIPLENHPKGTAKGENLVSISYWDLEKGEWRGFQIQKFMHIENAWTLMPNSEIVELLSGKSKV